MLNKGKATKLKAGTSSVLPFDPNGKIFRWGPVPGKFFYLSIFCEVHYKHFRKKFKKNWSETLYLFREGRMFWVNELEAVEKAGEEVFLEYMLPRAVRRSIYQEWKENASKLTDFEEKIGKAGLSDIPAQKFLRIWNDFNRLYTDFWVTGSVPELANYGSVAYLQRKLSEHISDQKIQTDMLEALTAPSRLSFYQEEEIDLSQTNDIQKHQQKYFWLKNSYAGTEVLPTSFFIERKMGIPSDFKIRALSKLENVPKRKHEWSKTYALSKEILGIAEAISEGVGWQDERKKIILKTLHYQDVLLHEVARRSGYSFADLQFLGHLEIARIIEGDDLHAEIAHRKEGFGLRFFHSCVELSAQEVSYFWDIYDSKTEAHRTSEIKGIVVSKGKNTKVIGPVRLLLDLSKSGDFQKGDILLAPMTSPEYIFAMRKSAAIVTDEGGLTSHAAIVSRELGIPCIVGTKIATKVLKDGDIVEVDANAGIVKILKRAT